MAKAIADEASTTCSPSGAPSFSIIRP
jgi:hypothetical protein